MAKKIDIVDIKKAIKEGQLEVYTKHSNYFKKTEIYLRDTQTGETVLIGEMKDEDSDIH